MEACQACGRTTCRPVYFRLCPECEGQGCPLCASSLVPGILPADAAEEARLVICTEWRDPEIDATLDDQRESLIETVIIARDRMRAE